MERADAKPLLRIAPEWNETAQILAIISQLQAQIRGLLLPRLLVDVIHREALVVLLLLVLLMMKGKVRVVV